ncbi:hypothetical protein C4564_03225 [Candidatus Microgenomates bacterium]|nr:MAG: hypothetical protein C4564_03225 [Candidatus Microgenomates bacterium]
MLFLAVMVVLVYLQSLVFPSFGLAYLGCKRFRNIGFDRYECPTWHPKEYLILALISAIALILLYILELIFKSISKKKLFSSSVFGYFLLFLTADIVLAVSELVNHNGLMLISLTFPFLVNLTHSHVVNKKAKTVPLKTLMILNFTALAVVIFKWLVAG